MKVIIATPVFPPEIGEISVYVKRFAKELKASAEEVTVLAYANHVEEIPEVKIRRVKKSNSLLIRLLEYTAALFRLSVGADVIYVCNTLASGLPAIIVGAIRNIPVIVRFAEDEVSERELRMNGKKKNPDKFSSEEDRPVKIRMLLALQQWVLNKASAISAGDAFLNEMLALTYEIPAEKISINRTPAPTPEILPIPPENFPRRILFALTEESKNKKEELNEIMDALKMEFPDAELFPIEESRISRAEKWHLLKSSGVCVFFSWDMESSLYACALSSGIPIVPFSEKDRVKTAVSKIMSDPEARTAAISEGKAILAAEYSWEAHLRNFIGLIPHSK
jgi:glycosyltransferase involved in cell wall biosynthesis